MGLVAKSDLKVEKYYRITGGYGAGETGQCMAVRESGFGMMWGEIRTPTGSYWTRWSQLEHADAPS